MSILEIVADNGFLPWQGGRDIREDYPTNTNTRFCHVSRKKDIHEKQQEGQNEDFSNMRLLSRVNCRARL